MEKHRFDYFASCPTGLEELLAQEIRLQGAKDLGLTRGGVAFSSEDNMLCLKVLLNSRTASRVFKLLYSFECHSEKAMYQELADIKWKSLLELTQTFKITTIFGKLPHDRRVFTNSQFVTLKAKDAIVDWFKHHTNQRPSIDKEHPDVSYLLRVDDAGEGLFKVQLLLDLSGAPLSNRGYRHFFVEAPARENLAAGILMMLNWDARKEGLLDGMCGSGTFLVEGALIAGGVSPQYLKLREFKEGRRAWAFLSSQWYTKDKYIQDGFAKLADETIARDQQGFAALRARKLLLQGYDRDNKAVQSARENVSIAGLSDLISIEKRDALTLSAPASPVLFVCNPPYGERLLAGEDEYLKELYHGLGELWKKEFKGSRAALLTGTLPLLKSIGLRTSKRLIVMNGDIECRVAEYQLF